MATYGGDGYTCGVFDYSTSQSNTAVTITVRNRVQQNSYYGSGYRARAYIDNTWKQATGYSTSASSSWVTIVDTGNLSKSFSRSESAYTVKIGGDFYGETVDGWDPGSRSGSTSYNVTIPALASYTVSYDANGGAGAPSSQKKYYGKTLTLSATKPTRDGYTFMGWATTSANANSGVVSYKSSASYTANSAATLYAVWATNSYLVTYDANGGVDVPDSQVKQGSANLVLTLDVPTKDQCTFYKWNTMMDGSGIYYNSGDTYSINSDIVLYAIWQPDKITNINAFIKDGVLHAIARTNNTIVDKLEWYISGSTDDVGTLVKDQTGLKIVSNIDDGWSSVYVSVYAYSVNGVKSPISDSVQAVKESDIRFRFKMPDIDYIYPNSEAHPSLLTYPIKPNMPVGIKFKGSMLRFNTEINNGTSSAYPNDTSYPDENFYPLDA